MLKTFIQLSHLLTYRSGMVNTEIFDGTSWKPSTPLNLGRKNHCGVTLRYIISIFMIYVRIGLGNDQITNRKKPFISS